MNPVAQLAQSYEESKFIPISYYRFNKENNTYSITTYPDYVIRNYEPFEIKNINTDKVINGNIHNKTGYHQYTFNGNTVCLKHVILGTMFFGNDDPINKNQVNHRNHIRNDNRICNLEWCTCSKNLKDRVGFKGFRAEFVDDIPEESITITKYCDHEFEDYFYYHDKEVNTDMFYWFNGIQYRILQILELVNGSKYVNMTDISNDSVKLCLSKFKKMYNLK